ncbi:hypothetical protein Trco_006965 [Trichoderma cornu-damae]|uniref:Uncharacterized protein n=1 Tax=Trichoderma cornu-damae TaxID=654480 RepID=A0A9P8TUE8_9HYPO|nr:hypothetical protein Trco_006965 [Trichoderma cornu-damae]
MMALEEDKTTRSALMVEQEVFQASHDRAGVLRANGRTGASRGARAMARLKKLPDSSGAGGQVLLVQGGECERGTGTSPPCSHPTSHQRKLKADRSDKQQQQADDVL